MFYIFTTTPHSHNKFQKLNEPRLLCEELLQIFCSFHFTLQASYSYVDCYFLIHASCKSLLHQRFIIDVIIIKLNTIIEL